MKITNHEIIRSGEKELIDTITGDLDWQSIETLFREKHQLEIQDDVELKAGDLVVCDDQVAYKLDFEVKVNVSVMFDRQGNHLSMTVYNDSAENGDSPVAMDEQETTAVNPGPESDVTASIATEVADGMVSADPGQTPTENLARLSADVGEMITGLNNES